MGYIGAIVVANTLTARFGLVPAGFGLTVVAGTYTAGLALSLRDVVQAQAGTWAAVAAMGVAAGLSALVSPVLAAASGAAFLLSELMDLAVFTPLRRRGWRRAVVLSNLVGAVADSVLFLTLAGLPVTGSSVGGQVLAKAVWVTAGVLLVAEGVRRALPRNSEFVSDP
ncbi:VUT family protein [Actinosynnema sp. NPDC020468]|uniref:VUT family protein n=1 Tax=Actinosynnema sp. NPDC020468 TaxID=3154488 RepID=UPI0034018D80